MESGKSSGSVPLSERERRYLSEKGIACLPSDALSQLRVFERQIEELRLRPIDQLFDDEAAYLQQKGIDPAQWSEQCKLYPIISSSSFKPTGKPFGDYLSEKFREVKTVQLNPILVRRGIQVIRLDLQIGHLLNENRRSGSASRNWRYIVIKSS